MVWQRTATATATAMAFRDQLRRPLVPILLVVVPAFIVIWSVAITQPESRRIELAGGVWVTTTMKALHGPEMAKFHRRLRRRSRRRLRHARRAAGRPPPGRRRPTHA